MRWAEAVAPLRHRPFRHQFLAQTVSLAGTALSPVALAFGVLGARGSTADLGLVLAAYTTPMVLFMLAGGVWADRLPRQRVMMSADAVRFVTQTVLGALLVTGHAPLWSMMALQALTGTATAFFLPASIGLTTGTATPQTLQQANSLLSLTRDLAATVGPLASGVIVATVGAGWALVLDGLTFGGSVLLLSRVSLPPRPAGPEPVGFLAELRDGLREVRARSWVWVSMGYFTVFHMAIGGFLVLGPATVAARPHGAVRWGAAIAALGLGQVVGNAVALRVQPRYLLRVGRYVALLCAPVFLALASAAGLPVLLASALLLGVGVSLPDALWTTALQQHVPERAISRVVSFDMVGSLVMRPVSYGLAVAAAASFGTASTLVAGGTLVLVTTLATLLVPSVRDLSRTDAHLVAGT